MNLKTQAPPEPVVSKVRPIAESLFSGEETSTPRLIASRCRVCRNTFYPTETMCPVDIAADTLDQVEIDGTGALVAFTEVRRGLPGFDSPYALAVVALDAGPSVIAQLHDWQHAELSLGMKVELVIGQVRTDADGTVVLGPKFRPAGEEARR